MRLPLTASIAEVHPASRTAARTPPVTVGRVHRRWLALERWTLLTLAAAAERRRARKTPAHLLTGQRGELEAMFFLRQRGYRFAERRWHAPGERGDLDLVGWDGDTLAFVEVKTRTARDLTPAEFAVDDTKRRTLRKLARAYRRTVPKAGRNDLQLRVDVVSVYLLPDCAECELIRDAFPLFKERSIG